MGMVIFYAGTVFGAVVGVITVCLLQINRDHDGNDEWYQGVLFSKRVSAYIIILNLGILNFKKGVYICSSMW